MIIDATKPAEKFSSAQNDKSGSCATDSEQGKKNSSDKKQGFKSDGKTGRDSKSNQKATKGI